MSHRYSRHRRIYKRGTNRPIPVEEPAGCSQPIIPSLRQMFSPAASTPMETLQFVLLRVVFPAGSDTRDTIALCRPLFTRTLLKHNFPRLTSIAGTSVLFCYPGVDLRLPQSSSTKSPRRHAVGVRGPHSGGTRLDHQALLR